MNLLLAMLMSGLCALGAVYMFELMWRERPPRFRQQWSKRSAMRFLWSLSGILIVLGQFPMGLLLGMAGLPICLAHLRLVDLRRDGQVSVYDVVRQLESNAHEAIRNLKERTREGPRQ